MLELELVSNLAGATAFALLVVLLLASWRSGGINRFVLGAAAISAAWFALQAYHYSVPSSLPLRTVQFVEVFRGAAWCACLLAILDLNRDSGGRSTRVRTLGAGLVALSTAQLFWVAQPDLILGWGQYRWDGRLYLLGFLALAILGLVLVEALYRNTRPEHRWSIRAFCFAIGGLFIYDIFLYAHAVLFNQIAREIWSVRGAVNALSVPLLALAMVRSRQWKSDIFLSRQVVFHGTAILLVGAYLLLMAGAGYALRRYGGSWGEALQIVFFFGALLVLLMLMASTQLRAHAKVFLAKHFYRNKYEYREEWLRFTRTLADCQGPRFEMEQGIIRAIAAIIDSRWGVLWRRHESEQFIPVCEWHLGALPSESEEPISSDFAAFLERSNWIIEIREGVAHSDAGELALPVWLRRMTNAWLVVPLVLSGRLLGFIVLARSLAARELDWEDRDLLKTVAQQTAGYVALINATEALADARQFEAFNRLSAFVVHDLKNLAAQLSLVVSNSKRHRDNPEFINDALVTVENAVTKLNRMVGGLRAPRAEHQPMARVALAPLLESIIAEHRLRKPVPVLKLDADCDVLVERAQLGKAVGHLIQNAQDATPETGRITIGLRRDGEVAVIEIADTGCGMDPEFVRDHLFRPFDTTKGNAGMGIGVYETRQIVIQNGGQFSVQSNPGLGTTFTIRLPLPDAQDGGVRVAAAGASR